MAYNAPHRPSILHRPVKNTAKANVENLDAEFEKEQQRIAARSERLASTEERLIKSFYGTEAEKRDSWQTTQQELQEHAAARQAAQMQERQREEQWLSQPQQVFVDTRQPWTAQSTTYYMSREEEAEARRRAQREAAEENRYMMQYRSFQQQQERELEREAIQRTMQSEEAWFNLGAANERWVPPERRIKQRAVVAPQFAVGPAPYYCEAEGSKAAVGAGFAERPNTAPARAGNTASEGQAAPQANPRRSAFWERESGQGMKSVLSHDVYFRREQAQPRRGTSHQEGSRPQPVCHPSPAPSTSSSRPGTATPGQRAAQPPPPQPKYPWSWE